MGKFKMKEPRVGLSNEQYGKGWAISRRVR